MADLSKDLSALRIPQTERGGSKRGASVLIGIVLAVLLAGGGFWFWSARLQAAPVKVAPVTAANAGGKSGPGAVLNASGYVTARRRATVSSKVTGKVVDVLIEEGHRGQGGSDSGPSRRHAGARVADPGRGAARRRAEERGRGSGSTRPGGADAAAARAAAERERRRQSGAGPGAVGRRFAQGAHRLRAAAGHRVGESGEPAEDTPRGHGRPCAVQRRRDLEGRAARRNDLARVGRRRLHAYGHLHDRRHVVARNRGRRQRELHQPRQERPESRSDARRVSRLADPGARHRDDSVRRPPEGHGEGSHRVRPARSRASCRTWE